MKQLSISKLSPPHSTFLFLDTVQREQKALKFVIKTENWLVQILFLWILAWQLTGLSSNSSKLVNYFISTDSWPGCCNNFLTLLTSESREENQLVGLSVVMVSWWNLSAKYKQILWQLVTEITALSGNHLTETKDRASLKVRVMLTGSVGFHHLTSNLNLISVLCTPCDGGNMN